jgi:dihydroflavonol-4-reductase
MGPVVVTGASGFVGKWVVLALLEAGYAVRGTVRSEAKADLVRAVVTERLGAEAAGRLDFVNADLLSDAGWAEAMEGAQAVMHVAAQILAEEPKDPQVVIAPAVEGTRRVLTAAASAGVKRVILTSSIAAVGYGHGQTSGKRVYSEADSTNLAGMRYTWAYCVGKTLAEQAAWEIAKTVGLELTTIHPGAILGPAVDADSSISLGMVSGLMDGSTPALPSNGFSVIDVRDVADLHMAALTKAESRGQRYLATSDYVPFPTVAAILRARYPERRITQRIVPDWIIRTMARFGGPTRQIINDIGNEKHYDRSKGEALLGRPFRSGEEAILATADSLIALKLLPA